MYLRKNWAQLAQSKLLAHGGSALPCTAWKSRPRPDGRLIITASDDRDAVTAIETLQEIARLEDDVAVVIASAAAPAGARAGADRRWSLTRALAERGKLTAGL